MASSWACATEKSSSKAYNFTPNRFSQMLECSCCRIFSRYKRFVLRPGTKNHQPISFHLNCSYQFTPIEYSATMTRQRRVAYQPGATPRGCVRVRFPPLKAGRGPLHLPAPPASLHPPSAHPHHTTFIYYYTFHFSTP